MFFNGLVFGNSMTGKKWVRFDRSELLRIIEGRFEYAHQIIQPVNRWAVIPTKHNGQPTIEGLEHLRLANEKPDHILLGSIYEVITQAIWGGRHRDNILMKRPKGQRELDVKRVVPDIIDDERRRILESKGKRFSDETLLVDRQVAKYADFQDQRPEWDFSFIYWVHPIKSTRDYPGDSFDMVREVAHGTFYALKIPFRIMLRLHGLPLTTEYETNLCSRYEPGPRKLPDGTQVERPHSTRIFPRVFQGLLHHPQRLIERVGLDPGSFTYEWYRSPMNLYVEEHRVSRFPILDIGETVPYGEWGFGYINPKQWRLEAPQRAEARMKILEEEQRVEDKEVEADEREAMRLEYAGGSEAELAGVGQSEDGGKDDIPF